jgi:hypothetical protein
MSDMKNQTRISRRTVFRATVVAMAGGLAMQARARNIDPALVRCHDHADGHRAGMDSAHVDPPKAGYAVEGEVRPDGWCAAFAPEA